MRLNCFQINSFQKCHNEYKFSKEPYIQSKPTICYKMYEEKNVLNERPILQRYRNFKSFSKSYYSDV
ncbi:hypothetical protein LEP1GSC176_2902 [Leptospira kirschneri str. MMD1493]|nr:hypothetical protein LEP1GSC176_2902 [Leptospira kirschneri str. MMD1493]